MAQQEIKHAVSKDENTQSQAIINAIRRLYSYEPYDGQRECLHYLIYQRTDLILIAKTSFGKSMMLQAVSVLIGKSITLVILPLQQTVVEQTQYIERIGGRPCFLNAETITNERLEAIKRGEFTHILISLM